MFKEPFNVTLDVHNLFQKLMAQGFEDLARADRGQEVSNQTLG